MSSASPQEVSGDSSIQSIRTRKTKISEKGRYHCHVSAATEWELTFDSNQAAVKSINALIHDDPVRLFYLLYISPGESHTVKGESASQESCLFAIGTSGTKHEIIVQSGDIFTVIASPGHLYCIRSENDEVAKVENFNLTLNQDFTTIINPLPGRQYNILVPIEPAESEFSNSSPSFIHINCFYV